MKKEAGATMVEYLLMVTIIAIALVAVIILLQAALTGNVQVSVDCVTDIVDGGIQRCPGATP